MDRPCDRCDHPNSSLLRIVLIGEIIRADDDTLYALAEVCESLGLMQLADEDSDSVPAEPARSSKSRLRRIK